MNKSWLRKTIGELCEKGGGKVQTGPFGSQLHQTDYSEEGTPVVMPTDIPTGQINVTRIARVSETHIHRLSRHKLRKGDIVYGSRGDIGRQALVREENVGWLCGTGCLRIRLGTSEVDPEYLHRYLTLPEIKGWIEGQAVGATMPNLNTAILNRVPVCYPGLGEQRKIAAILTAYDDLIETNKRRIALLEKMAEEIYREWFVRMRFPGHRTVKFVKGVPEGWEPMPSSDMFDVLSGGTPKTDVPRYWDGPIPFFTPKDAPDHIYVSTTEKWITDKGLNSCNSRLYPKNTIFITARGTVGKLALAQCDMAMNQSCYALVPKFDEEVFFFYLSISNAIEIIKGVSKSGVFDNIIIDTFRIIPIYFPGRRLIKKFNDIAGPIFSQLECLLSANARLAKTRDILLPRLISGKLSVADLDIQFPPSIRDDIEAPNHRE